MFCKNCGKQLDSTARFCDACGTQVAQPQPPQQPQQEAPRQFQQSYVDQQRYQYEKSGFIGKQTSFGTSGSIGFGNPGRKKRGFLWKVFVFIVSVSILAVLYTLFFGSDITNVQMGTGIDSLTDDIVGEGNTFDPTTSQIFIFFDFAYETGTVIESEWYYEDEYIGGGSLTVPDDTFSGYFFFDRPLNGSWDIGDYEVQLIVDGEVVHTESFTVE